MTPMLAVLCVLVAAWALVTMVHDLAALLPGRRRIVMVPTRPAMPQPERQAPPIFEEHAEPLSPRDHAERQLERDMQAWQERPSALSHGR